MRDGLVVLRDFDLSADDGFVGMEKRSHWLRTSCKCCRGAALELLRTSALLGAVGPFEIFSRSLSRKVSCPAIKMG